MPHTPLRDFEAFAAVAAAGSFIGGAQALGIGASAMSQAVRRLEDRVGVQLFHRTTRSVSLTSEGERLMARLRVAFGEVEEAARELAARRSTPAGTVRLMLPRIAYEDLVEPRLASLAAAYPDIVLDVRLDDAYADIVGEGYDLGVRLGEYVDPETVAFPIGPSLRQLAVAAPGYLAAHGTPRHPRELAAHRCIGWRQSPDAQPYAWEFERDGEAVAVAVRGPLILNDRAAAVRAAAQGLGIALWVEHRLTDRIERGELAPLLADWSPPYRGFFLYYYRDRNMSAATRAVLSFLRAAVQEPLQGSFGE